MEKAILMGVCLQTTIDFEENIEEMKNLAAACNIEVVDTITQNLRSPHRLTYINSGKLDEVKSLMEQLEVEKLIFDCELSPSQLHNLEKELDCEIFDKTFLILQIFELRAKTKEAIDQVEVAKLKYLKPRLSGSYASMDKQRGGNHNKGSGEKKIELDFRNIDHQIHCLERDLKEVAKQRTTQRRQRNKKDIKSVALVGYTNAGKSSIMNAFMDRFNKEDKKVFEKDMLFATLTTNTRNIKLESNNEFLISDTVGFVSDLPHNLIKAFHSTLEEVIAADLLIQVIDMNSNEHQKHIRVTNETLHEIGASNIEMLYVYNKCDLVDHEYPLVKDDHIFISAKDKHSVSLLLDVIESKLFKNIEVILHIPYEEGALISLLNEKANILDQSYLDNCVEIIATLEDELYQKVKIYSIEKEG